MPTYTTVVLHGHAEARSFCDIYVWDQGQCVYRSTQNRTVNNIARVYYYPPNGVQPYLKTFGLDPATGATAFYNILDSQDLVYSTGPSHALLGWEGAYTFYTDNLINITSCHILPNRISAAPIRLYARKAHPRRDCPSDGAVTFGNPCNALTGNKTQTEIDWPGPALRIARTYNSESAYIDTGFGYGWSSPLLRRVFRGGDRVIIERGSGESELFTLNNGVWVGDTVTRYKVTNGPNGSYVVSNVDGSVEHYNAAGLLLDEVDQNGRTTVFQYDASSRLTAVVDPFGRTFTVTYDGSSSRIASISDGQAQSTTYQYDSNGALIRVVYPDSSSRSYTYQLVSNAGNIGGALLTEITDENGTPYVAWSYDSSGRVASSQRAPASPNPVDVHSFSYPSSSTSAVTDPLGVVWTLTYSTYYGEPVLRTKTNSVDNLPLTQTLTAYGLVATRTDRLGNKSCYSYDSARDYLETIRVEGVPSGSTCFVFATSLPAGSRKISTQWHPDFQLQTKRAEPGRVTTYVYNGRPDPFNGNATASCAPSTAVLGDGRPIPVLCRQVEQATTDTNGVLGFNATLQSGIANREQRWTYNQSGQVLTFDGPRTDVTDTTSYSYYTDTTADHRVGDLQSVTNSVGQVTQYTKYNRYGQVLETIDPNGVVTTHAYDLRQRLLTTNVGGEATTYTYDATGQLTRVTWANGSYIGYSYDDAHRLVAVYDNLGNREDYTLDVAGNRIAENVIDPMGSLRRQLSRSFDSLSRMVQLTGGVD